MTGRLRRRPVVYRVQIWTWLAMVAVSATLAMLAVPTVGQKVVASVALGVAAVAAAVVWRISEYRVYRRGPVTSTGSNLWLVVNLAICFSLARTIGGGGPYHASVAGFGAGMAIGLPLTTWTTALRNPPSQDADETADER